jgi:hypothetical protein
MKLGPVEMYTNMAIKHRLESLCYQCFLRRLKPAATQPFSQSGKDLK